MLRNRVHRIWFGAMAIVLPWTLFWFVDAWPHIMNDTAIGNGSWRPTLQGHEVFQFLFVSAVYFVRWLPGAVLPLAAAVVLTWRERRHQLAVS